MWYINDVCRCGASVMGVSVVFSVMCQGCVSVWSSVWCVRDVCQCGVSVMCVSVVCKLGQLWHGLIEAVCSVCWVSCGRG